MILNPRSAELSGGESLIGCSVPVLSRSTFILGQGNEKNRTNKRELPVMNAQIKIKNKFVKSKSVTLNATVQTGIVCEQSLQKHANKHKHWTTCGRVHQRGNDKGGASDQDLISCWIIHKCVRYYLAKENCIITAASKGEREKQIQNQVNAKSISYK